MHRWLRYCVKKAGERTTEQKYRLHSVLIRGGSVISQGINLSVSECYGRSANPKAPEWIGLHAEIACLRRVTEPSGAVLYVGGVTASGALLLSKPCKWCWDSIKEAGIVAVVWHDPDGITHTHRFRHALIKQA